jgi:hypothetical protein
VCDRSEETVGERISMFGVFIQEGRKRRAQTQARAYPRDFSLSEKPRKKGY